MIFQMRNLADENYLSLFNQSPCISILNINNNNRILYTNCC